MTIHPNAQLLQTSYQGIEHGDLQPMLNSLRDDMTWIDSTVGPLAGSYRRDEVPQFFGKMMDVYADTLRVEIAAMIADDDHGIVLTRESGTIDGEHVAWTGVHVYTFDSGRVTRFVSYGSAEYQRFWTDKHAAVSR